MKKMQEITQNVSDNKVNGTGRYALYPSGLHIESNEYENLPALITKLKELPEWTLKAIINAAEAVITHDEIGKELYSES